MRGMQRQLQTNHSCYCHCSAVEWRPQIVTAHCALLKAYTSVQFAAQHLAPGLSHILEAAIKEEKFPLDECCRNPVMPLCYKEYLHGCIGYIYDIIIIIL